MLTPAPKWLTERPIAHRALHDLQQGRAENSLGAFQAAINADYAIECDIQLSNTGEPMVFHDATLDRMTNVSGNVIDHSVQQLQKIKLAGTNDGIHTLKTHLDLVAGKVPVIIELKNAHKNNKALVSSVAKVLSTYNGPVAVMSFFARICSKFADVMPNIPRGLTAEGSEAAQERHLKRMDKYDLQFVSYNVSELPNRFVAQMKEQHIPVITWTVNTYEKMHRSYEYADQITFEGISPEPPDSVTSISSA